MIPDINLLPHLGKRRSDSKFVYLIMASVVLVTIVFFVWQLATVNQEVSQLEQQQQLLQADRAQLQVEHDLLANVNTGSLEQSLAFVERIAYPVSPLMVEVSTLLPQHAYFRKYSFGISRLSIEADFETITAVAGYVAQLKNSKYFTDVQPSIIKSFVTGPNEATNETPQTDFSDIPRYKVTIELFINDNYLAAGEVQ